MALETLTPSDQNTFDIIIIGGGPAGLSAALYSGLSNLKVAFIEKEIPGGKIVNIPKVMNYPGVKNIQGADLALNMYNQAIDAGAKYIFGAASGIVIKNNYRVVFLDNGVNYFSKAVIIAIGISENKLNIDGESRYRNHGVSYCVYCDGPLTKNKNVAIVVKNEESWRNIIYLANIAKKVFVINEDSSYKDIDKLSKYKNVLVMNNTSCKSIKGNDNQVTTLIVNDNGKEVNIDLEFVFIDGGSHNDYTLLGGFTEIFDANNTLIVNKNMETKIPGIFVAGDIAKNNFHQISTAVSDGAIASLSAIEYIKEQWK